MAWYFHEAGRNVGPVSEEEMRGRAAAGVLRPEVLVWREGMRQWGAAGEVTDWVFGAPPEGGVAEGGAVVQAAAIPLPNAAGVAHGGTSHVGAGVLGYVQKSEEALTLSPRVLDVMAGMGPWVRFIAVLGYVFVVLCFFTGAGMFFALMMARSPDMPAAVGLLYILMGVLYLFPSGYLNRSASAIVRLRRLHRTVDLEEALEAQRRFWKFCGVLMIVIMAGYVVAIGVAIAMKLH